MKRPMLLTPTEDFPTGEKWSYEVKYDGYRVLLHATEDGIKLWSRNGNDLSARFPEITQFEMPKKLDPCLLDGELVILQTRYQANFPLLQKRGRMKSPKNIQKFANRRPVTFLAFDLLDELHLPLKNRKKKLAELLQKIRHPRIDEIDSFTNEEIPHEEIRLHAAEGMVAKLTDSKYQFGSRSQHWLKWKQWRTVSGFLTSYDTENGYYDIAIKHRENTLLLGRFKHGLTSEQAETLKTFFKENGRKKKTKWSLEPSICLDVHCLDASEGELREPQFHQFRFDLSPEDCTYEKLQWDLSLFPKEVETTHLDKKLWPHISKRDYLLYIRQIAPYMMPFIKEKKLTLIRYPDGIDQPSFYQKHSPDYAPDYVKEWKEGGKKFVVCENLSSLIWLTNQGSLEYHIPFEKAGSTHPDEIVLDLDPPDRKHFHLAITAAQLFKHVLDELEVISFVKTSGNKGMQIHIPIPEKTLSYEETRQMTEKLATLLVTQESALFTTERLKKKRGNRLYIDYVQHAEGKTIIAPYSARATEAATVATPLFWEEVNEELSPEAYTVSTMMKRLLEKGCPFFDYEKARGKQPIKKLKELIRK